MPSMLDAALNFCKRGWSVIPLKFSGDENDKKRPLLDSWEPYQRECATEEQVRAWWAKWPLANIGVVMGKISGLVALDLDGPNAVALLHQKHIFLPETGAVQTGKGYHAIYKHPGVTIPNKARLLDDGQGSALDVRGDGGYIVAPPSVHGTGRVYQWVIQPEKIVDLPPGVLTLLTAQNGRSQEEESGWVSSVWAGVPSGQRNDAAARLAGYWLAVTKGNEYATRLAMEPWAARCTPPLDLKELAVTIKSIARREIAKQQQQATEALPHQAVVEGPQWAEELRDMKPREGQHVPVPGLEMVGGLVPGDLIVMAGRPRMGKSTWACQLAVEACLKQHIPTWIVSTEMTRHQWGRWMAAIIAETNTDALPRPLTPAILNPFRLAPIGVSDAGTVSIAELRELAAGRLGVKLIIVDHLTRITATRKENRVLEVGEVARGLKSLAKDLGCTVVALCQLNRRVESDDNKRPRLADLRESGEVEQEADTVAFLWSAEANIHQAKLPMWITIEKYRHGGTGDVPVIFDKPLRCFHVDLKRQKGREQP